MRSTRDRLVYHVRELERLEEQKVEAGKELQHGFRIAKAAGFDPGTLRVILRLRKMTPEQRSERRALEAIYLAALGMLEGDALPEEARRRLDGGGGAPAPPSAPPSPAPPADPGNGKAQDSLPPEPSAPTSSAKDPDQARQEGRDAAAAGKRVYDNPYPAGDPCRASWDEGWCEQSKSHGMDPPAAYQRRSKKPPEPDPAPEGDGQGEPDEEPDDQDGDDAGGGDQAEKGGE